MSDSASANEQRLLAASVLAQMGSSTSVIPAAPASIDSPPMKKKPKAVRKRKQPEPDFPVAPRVIQTIYRPKTVVNHTYRDLSVVPAAPTDTPLDQKSIEAMSFGEKIYAILSQAEYARWVRWNPHGRSFRILMAKRLEQGQVLEKYFGHSRYSSFLRQLGNNGFKHITKGQDRNSYYHECLLQGLPHLLKYMPATREVRRQVPDPENEPDFYALHQKHPLKAAAGSTSVVSSTATKPGSPQAPVARSQSKPIQPIVNAAPASSMLPLKRPLSVAPQAVAPRQPTVLQTVGSRVLSSNKMSLKRPAAVALAPQFANIQSQVVPTTMVASTAAVLPNKVPRVMMPQNFMSLAQQFQQQLQKQQQQRQPVRVISPPQLAPQRLQQQQQHRPTIDVALARARLASLQQEQSLLTAWLQTQPN